MQGGGNVIDPHTLTAQTVNSFDNLCRRFIHNELLFIILVTLVAIGDGTTAPQTVLHSGFEYSFYLVARIFRIPLIHNV